MLLKYPPFSFIYFTKYMLAYARFVSQVRALVQISNLFWFVLLPHYFCGYPYLELLVLKVYYWILWNIVFQEYV